MLRTTKHVFVAALAFIVAEPCLAQGGVGINNPAPHASALLDLTSTSKGLLTPRMTTAQRTSIAAPATGLLVFDTSLNAFWYYDGATWVPLTSGSAGWATTGNAGTVMGTHFIGTTDNVPFSFRVNGIAAGRIDHIGENASLGRSASAALTTGGGNVAVGDSAGASMTASTRNTFVGWNAGAAHNGSGWNTFVGAMVLTAVVNYLLGVRVMLFMPAVACIVAAMTFSTMGSIMGRVWYVPAAIWAAMAIVLALLPKAQFAIFSVLWALTQGTGGALLHRQKLRLQKGSVS